MDITKIKLLTAKEATSLIAQGLLAKYIKQVDKEIRESAEAGNSVTQIRPARHLMSSTEEVLRLHGYIVERLSDSCLHITWQRP